MSPYAHDLETAPADAAVVGGKANGLVALARAGLPVPPGFVLTADAFRAFLRENGLGVELEDGAGALAHFRHAHWPDALRSALEQAYAELGRRSGGVAVAARSSATVEDSARSSFAGQHATVLNLDGVDAVLGGVLECWASLYSAEAMHYRRARGVDDDGPAMAVVVQALVQAEASGVAFTLDPVSGERDLVVVEAAWGLGEGVVGGLVTPDHFAVRKADGGIVRREIAAKRARVVPAAGGGTQSEELSAERARQPALSDGQLVEIAQLAVRIEELMGGPQDVEWALADGRFFVLQARPVTAVGGPPAGPAPAAPPAADTPPADESWVSEFDTPTAPDTIWTAANVQEVLPDQLLPFGCSVTQELVERYGTGPIERVGVRLRNADPFSAYFYGRAFLNVSMMLDVAAQTPFGSVEAIMEQFFGQRRDEIAPPARLTLSKLLRYAAVLPRMIVVTGEMPERVRLAERIIEAFEQQDEAQPIDRLSDEQLVRRLDRGLPRGGAVAIIHVAGGGVTSAAFEWLRRVTEHWLGDETGTLQARLCTGLSGVESAQPAHELWELSRMVLASEPLGQAFAADAGAEIERRLAALPQEQRDDFDRRLAAFLKRHGHRSVMEAEFAARTWEEDLPTVFAMLRNYLHADPSADPRRVERRQRRERLLATRESLRRLSWWQRPVFRYVLSQAQEWVVIREHTKSLMVRATNRGRRLTREIARRMTGQGLLDDPWDFYYLTWDEAKALIRRELARDDAYAQVRRRKEEEARNRQVVLPETFRGHPKPLRPEDRPLPEGRVLHGIPVSPGRVSGPARVIFDPRRDAGIEPGEILVAPVTDAGWTPLFIAAAGVVVDVGGSLSHGSTVAREYGLPAVVNVKHGTRMIRTGQRITVDGDTGVVVLEDGG